MASTSVLSFYATAPLPGEGALGRWLSTEDLERESHSVFHPGAEELGNIPKTSAAQQTGSNNKEWPPRALAPSGEGSAGEGEKRHCNGGTAASQQPNGAAPRLTLYGRSVRRAALDGVDASAPMSSATSTHFRINRSLLTASAAEDVLALLERSLNEFDDFHCGLAVHRLARHARLSQAPMVLRHVQWPRLVERLRAVADTGEPRQVASVAWALANLLFRDAALRDAIAQRCVRRVPADWDPMSLSLVPQSFAMLAARNTDLFATVSVQVRRETSATWLPGDVGRVVWACAKVLHRDDALLRDCSCKALSRLPESTPSILAQTIWAFATVAPPDVASHCFPYVAEAMRGPGLETHSSAHLAMIVWAFAAVLFRPVELLEEIGDTVAAKSSNCNSQDITMIAWSYATLLAPQRRVFEFLASAATRTVRAFNAQDLSNTAWAFATAGEHAIEMLDAVADEACARPSDFNCQHIAMLLWAFVTIRHRHSKLFAVIGALACVDQSSWHSAKLLAYALGGLPRMNEELGSRETTLKVASDLVEALLRRMREGTGETDDAHTVHDGVFPWLGAVEDGAELQDPEGWRVINDAVSVQRKQLVAFTRSPVFESILPARLTAYDLNIVREYQCAVQALGVRGLGSVHTWRFLQEIGLQRASLELARLATRTRESQPPRPAGQGEAGRGDRANWCYWRARVRVVDPNGSEQVVEEPGRLQNSTVVGYREDCAGLVAVKLCHDRVNHRSWDCEFRAMSRTAAAARALLSGRSLAESQAMMDVGAAEAPVDNAEDVEAHSCHNLAAGEASVEGYLEIHMTEVPCLSCICAAAQFRRRFQLVSLLVSWEGMPRCDVDRLS